MPRICDCLPGACTDPFQFVNHRPVRLNYIYCLPTPSIELRTTLREIREDIVNWESAGQQFALARVIQTWGSSPRQVGAAMIIGPDMAVSGSVSGGCIEGAVITEAEGVLADGVPRKLHYGVSDETAWSVGLTCGGEVSVFVEKHLGQAGGGSAEVWEALRARLEANLPAVLLTRLASWEQPHLLIDPQVAAIVAGDWVAAAGEAL
ncbi:MAG TPA: hypothetical protein DIC52_13500, partial [Candidatus Latescibacteria bacterium]|nr:hypothetical protein [Candidatus Latescibacterota bacterium]